MSFITNVKMNLWEQNISHIKVNGIYEIYIDKWLVTVYDYCDWYKNRFGRIFMFFSLFINLSIDIYRLIIFDTNKQTDKQMLKTHSPIVVALNDDDDDENRIFFFFLVFGINSGKKFHKEHKHRKQKKRKFEF